MKRAGRSMKAEGSTASAWYPGGRGGGRVRGGVLGERLARVRVVGRGGEGSG